MVNLFPFNFVFIKKNDNLLIYFELNVNSLKGKKL